MIEINEERYVKALEDAADALNQLVEFEREYSECALKYKIEKRDEQIAKLKNKLRITEERLAVAASPEELTYNPMQRMITTLEAVRKNVDVICRMREVVRCHLSPDELGTLDKALHNIVKATW